MKFYKIANEWIEEHQKNIEYYTFYNMYDIKLKKINNYFGDWDIEKIKIKDLQKYINDMSYMNNYSKSTIQKYKITITQIFAYAYINGYISTDPSIYLKLPKTKIKDKLYPLDDLKVKKILNNIDDNLGFYAVFLIFTGLRRSEALAVHYEDIDFDRLILNVNKVVIFKGNTPEIRHYLKNGEIREITIPNIIAEKLDKKGKGLIFKNYSGNLFTKAQIEKAWRKYISKYDLKITQHQCRHTYASMLYKSGVDIKTAQFLLGHKTLQVTLDTYTHLDSIYKNKNIDKFNNYINENIYT